MRTTASRWQAPRSLRLVLLLIAIAAASARADWAPDVAPVRPIRLEGYWAPPASERVRDEVTVSADGRERRTFYVTALQAYKPEEEGAHVLRHSALNPVTVLLRGREEMVRSFLRARPDEKVVAYGVYHPGGATLTLSGVEINPPAAARRPD